MANDRLGTTIIDELRLCFLAEPVFLDTLSGLRLGEHLDLDKFSILRVVAQNFEYYFNLIANEQVAAYIYFGRYGDVSNYLWVKVNNKILYDEVRLRELLSDIQSTFPIKFNNITKIDLAKDFKRNITYSINRLCRAKDIKTIINGKVVKDRKKVVKELKYTYEANLERVMHPSITLCQIEAIRNKSKGVTVQAYNKLAEVDKSNKEYIKEFYGNPKTLHRLEVRLNYNEIRDFYILHKRTSTTDDIFDKEFMTEMFYYHLGSVLRFTRGRKPISWREILCTDNTR